MSSIASGTTTTTGLVYTSDTTGNLVLQTNGTTTAVTIDTNQNVGIGVTPSAWGSSYKSLDSNSNGASFAGGGYSSFVASNLYNDNTNWRYKGATYGGTLYSQFNGIHVWSNYSGTPSAGGVATLPQAMTLDNSGRLIVNSTSPITTSSQVSSTCSGANVYAYSASTSSASAFYATGVFNSTTVVGGLYWNGTNTVVLATSDRRLKDNIQTLTNSGEIIDSLKPRTFTWNTTNTNDVGFIADELQSVMPNAVVGSPNETKEEEYEVTPAVKDSMGNITTPAVMGTRTVPVYQQVNTTNQELIAYLVAEVQSLRARLKAANIA